MKITFSAKELHTSLVTDDGQSICDFTSQDYAVTLDIDLLLKETATLAKLFERLTLQHGDLS